MVRGRDLLQLPFLYSLWPPGSCAGNKLDNRGEVELSQQYNQMVAVSSYGSNFLEAIWGTQVMLK